MRRPLPLLAVLSLAVGLCVSGCSASTSSGGQEPIREAAADTAAPVSGPSAAPAGASAAPSASSSELVAHGAEAAILTATARDRAVELTWGPVPTDLPPDATWGIEYWPSAARGKNAWAYVRGMTAVTISGLTNGVDYTFSLEKGPGVYSPWPASATPMPAPGPPDGLIALTKQPGQITFDWLSPRQGTRPTSFAVRYRVNDGQPVRAETNDNTESYTVKDLRPGDVVTLAASSRNQYGTSGWSTERTANAS